MGWNPFSDKLTKCIFENKIYEKKKNIIILGSFIIFLFILILILIIIY